MGPHTHLVTYLELRTEAKVDAHLDPLVAWVQGVVDPSWGHTWDLVPLDRDLLEESYVDHPYKDHLDLQVDLLASWDLLGGGVACHLHCIQN